MAMDFRSALVDQLDPTQKKPPPWMPPSGNTGVAGSMETKMPAMPQMADAGPALGAAPSSGPLKNLSDIADPSIGGGLPAAAGGASRSPNLATVMGVNVDKFNDPNKKDFKYDTMRTLSGFDPKQGFTPEVIAALNKLDYGTFSGSGDKLGLSGAKNSPDAADFSPQDWIYAMKAQNGDTKWNFGGGGAGGGNTPQGGGHNSPWAGSGVSSMLQSNAGGNLQQALSGLEQPGLLQQLIAALNGGG